MEGCVMALNYVGLLADLRHETDQLAGFLGSLAPQDWDLPSPAAGWSVKDQVTHLAFFDDAAIMALERGDDFRGYADELIAGGMDFPDRVAEDYRMLAPATVRSWFTDSRSALIVAFVGQDPKRRLPWFGPDMSVASSVTARLMETWAHSQDVYDALGAVHPPSRGLRHIAHLGVSTFGFAHTLNGLDIPDVPVYVELRSAAGHLWCWGPTDALDRVKGTAEDFVLTVTQRRHWSETGLLVDGPVARTWLDIAQAFAGAPSRRLPTAVRR